MIGASSRLFTNEWNTHAKVPKREQIENNLQTKCQMNTDNTSSVTSKGTVDSIFIHILIVFGIFEKFLIFNSVNFMICVNTDKQYTFEFSKFVNELNDNINIDSIFELDENLMEITDVVKNDIKNKYIFSNYDQLPINPITKQLN